MTWRIICVNHGIETEDTTTDLNEYFKFAGIDKEEYGEDYFKIEVVEDD